MPVPQEPDRPFFLRRESRLLNGHSLLHEDMRHLYNFFPRDAHPMPVFSSAVSALNRPHARARIRMPSSVKAGGAPTRGSLPV